MWGYVPCNVADAVVKPKVPKHDDLVTPDPDQLRKLIESEVAAEDRFTALYQHVTADLDTDAAERVAKALK